MIEDIRRQHEADLDSLIGYLKLKIKIIDPTP